MDGYRAGRLFLVLMGLFGLTGASCPNMVQQITAPPPRALPPTPTLEQVIEVVNRNNSQIHSFATTHATLSGPGLPTLRASLAFQRARRFRLVAETAVTGPEVDFGSNEEYFWFWIKRNQPPAIYFCRHDQYATSPARRWMPVNPQWLVEALGVTELDPALPHQGPFVLEKGRLLVRTIRETPEGPMTKSTVIDGVHGWVVGQQIHDAQGRLLASSTASAHRQDPLSGLVMPGIVKVDCPAARFSMRVDLGNVQINRLAGNPGELWTMPTYPDSPIVNLGNPNWRAPPNTVPGISRGPARQRSSTQR